jgi:hypothetical protein
MGREQIGAHPAAARGEPVASTAIALGETPALGAGDIVGSPGDAINGPRQTTAKLVGCCVQSIGDLKDGRRDQSFPDGIRIKLPPFAPGLLGQDRTAGQTWAHGSGCRLHRFSHQNASSEETGSPRRTRTLSSLLLIWAIAVNRRCISTLGLGWFIHWADPGGASW